MNNETIENQQRQALKKQGEEILATVHEGQKAMQAIFDEIERRETKIEKLESELAGMGSLEEPTSAQLQRLNTLPTEIDMLRNGVEKSMERWRERADELRSIIAQADEFVRRASSTLDRWEVKKWVKIVLPLYDNETQAIRNLMLTPYFHRHQNALRAITDAGMDGGVAGMMNQFKVATQTVKKQLDLLEPAPAKGLQAA
jgi:hypothetical protein